MLVIPATCTGTILAGFVKGKKKNAATVVAQAMHAWITTHTLMPVTAAMSTIKIASATGSRKKKSAIVARVRGMPAQ